MSRLPWLASAAALVLGAYFAVRFPGHHTSPAFAVAGILALALPSFIAALRWLGPRRGAALLLTLSVLAYVVEMVGVVTGWPYGDFEYGTGIGPKLAGRVPVLLPLAYVPLVLGALVIADRRRVGGRAKWYVVGLAALVAADLVVDPGAVAMGYWTYTSRGFYYGVPLANYVGWLVSGALALALASRWVVPDSDRYRPPPPALAFSAFASVAYWASIAMWLRLWFPLAVGVVLLLGLLPQERGHGSPDGPSFRQ